MEIPGYGRNGFEMLEGLEPSFSSPVEQFQKEVNDENRVEERQERIEELQQEEEKSDKGHEQARTAEEEQGIRKVEQAEHELEVGLNEQAGEGLEQRLDAQKTREKACEAGVSEQADEQLMNTTGDEERNDEKQHLGSPESEQAFESSLPRNLSSPDRAIREKALTVLGEWLASCKRVEEAQLVAIWKSLLFLVWNTSKGPAQVELSKSITLILGRLTPDLALITFKVFLSMMVKEWSGIDKKRIDKFRSLLQLCLRQIFSLLELQRWNEDLTRKFVEVVGATEGVNIFLLQAYLQELRSFVPPTPEVLRLLLEPFFVSSVNCSSKVVLQKIRDSVFLPLLQEARAALGKQSEELEHQQQQQHQEEKKTLGSLVLALSMGSKFSELSASPSIAPNNKKLLQQLYEDFSRSDKPLLALRPVKKPKDPIAGAQQLPPSPTESVTGRKRKRVNAGEGAGEHRRVLRSEKKLLLAQQQVEWDPECDPVVLNLEEKLTLLGNPRSDDEARYETSEKTTSSSCGGVNEDESEAEQQQNAAKRVRFSLRNNIVWAPHKPLPPQWVRVPPCAAPRGSAMKAGVLPGPIAQPSPKRGNKERQEKKKKRKKRGGGGKGNKRKKSATPPRSKRLKSGQ